MIRLTKSNINIPALSEQIFKDRWNEDIHTVDGGRFDQLAKHFKGGKYLDIGCFNSPKPGELAEDPNNEVTALDHAPRVIAVMQSKFPKVNYEVGDCYGLPYEDKYFDYVVAGELLEHLERSAEFVAEAIRVLKPGGVLAISTPYKETVFQPLISKEHLWSFDDHDMRFIFGGIGEVTIETNEDNLKVFIVFVRKPFPLHKVLS